MNTNASVKAVVVRDADKTYSILINNKRVPRLNHHGYINSVIHRLTKESQKYPGSLENLEISKEIASVHDLSSFLFAILTPETGKELLDLLDRSKAFSLVNWLSAQVGLSQVEAQTVLRHIHMSCQDVAIETLLLLQKKDPAEVLLDLKKMYPLGIYVPPLDY